MLTRTSLQRLAQVRLDDALLLLQSNRPSSAYYLAGYAVELGLKACISRQVRSDTIPDKGFVNAIYTHSPERLLSLAGLKPQFDADARADSQLAGYWAIVNNWNEESRYEPWDPIAAASLLEAVNDPAHGVFRWLKQHW
jgi:HEPN domain-containing protein